MKDHRTIIDEKHNIVWVNDVAEQLYGSNIVGKKCYTIYHGRNESCEECVLRKTIADGKVHKDKVEFIGIDGNKMIFWCIVSVVARHADGRPKLVAEIRRDITERE